MVKGFPVVFSPNGIPVRPVSSNAPLMTVADNGYGLPITISDNGAPFIVEQPTPPVPGPLDAEFQEEGLTTLTVEYDLAATIAVLGVATRYAGTLTSLTATHGGEALTLARIDINTTEKIASAVFYGSGLTIEPANVVVTPVGATTLGPAMLRVNDNYFADVLGSAWNAGNTGRVARETPVNVVSGVSGDGGVIFAAALSETAYEPYAMPQGEYQNLFWGKAFAGTRVDSFPLIITGSSPAWSLVGGEYVHATVGDGYLARNVAPAGSTGFGIEIDVSIPAGASMSVTYYSLGGSAQGRTVNGPFDGVWRDIGGPAGFSLVQFLIGAVGAVTVKGVNYIAAPKTILGCFGRTNASSVNGDTFSMYLPTVSQYAVSAAEIHDV